MSPNDSSGWVVMVGLLMLLGLRSCSAPENPGPGPTTERLSNLALLIVEDSSRRTPDQAALLTSPEFRRWATASCARLRVVDVAAVRADGQPSGLLQPYRDWRSVAGNQSVTLPVCLLVRSDGSVYRGGPLPDSSAGVKSWCESLTVP